VTEVGDAYIDREADTYWDYQRRIGEIGGELNLWKFASHLRPGDRVLDFGCGGGFLLERLPAASKVGVEPLDSARERARSIGLEVVAHASELPGSSVDVVVSNHALEHVLEPVAELRGLLRVLRPGGKIVLVVPINDWRSERAPNPADPNHHLYTWTPVLIANLFTVAGFERIDARVVAHAWTFGFQKLEKRLPRSLYKLAARLFATMKRRREVHAVAYRPYQ
jgi:SAM-dependent methyltransferase